MLQVPGKICGYLYNLSMTTFKTEAINKKIHESDYMKKKRASANQGKKGKNPKRKMING